MADPVTPGNSDVDAAYEDGLAAGFDEAFSVVRAWLAAEHPDLVDELSEHASDYSPEYDQPMALAPV